MRSSQLSNSTTVSALLAAVSVSSSIPAHAVQRMEWLARVERSRQDCAYFVGAAIERREHLKNSSETVFTPARPSIDEADPTLRYGDIVVRAGRLVVFRGRPGEPQTASAFKEIGGEQLGGVHDQELQLIDAALRLSRSAE